MASLTSRPVGRLLVGLLVPFMSVFVALAGPVTDEGSGSDRLPVSNLCLRSLQLAVS